MTSEREALLQGIRERPFDDAPRLVAADWLEESGYESDAVLAEGLRWCVSHGKYPVVVNERGKRVQRWYLEPMRGPDAKHYHLSVPIYVRVQTDLRLNYSQHLDAVEAYTAVGLSLADLREAAS